MFTQTWASTKQTTVLITGNGEFPEKKMKMKSSQLWEKDGMIVDEILSLKVWDKCYMREE